MSCGKICEKISDFLKKWVNAEDYGYIRKRNVDYNGTKLAMALYTKSAWIRLRGSKKAYVGVRIIGGIKEETYEQMRDFIEKELERLERERELKWVKKALDGTILKDSEYGFKILAERVPADVWKKIKPYMFYVNSSWYADMDMDYIDPRFRYYGWAVNDEGMVIEILRAEAEKRAKDLGLDEGEIEM